MLNSNQTYDKICINDIKCNQHTRMENQHEKNTKNISPRSFNNANNPSHASVNNLNSRNIDSRG